MKRNMVDSLLSSSFSSSISKSLFFSSFLRKRFIIFLVSVFENCQFFLSLQDVGGVCVLWFLFWITFLSPCLGFITGEEKEGRPLNLSRSSFFRRSQGCNIRTVQEMPMSKLNSSLSDTRSQKGIC
jgi:hypothetical protein